MSELRKVQVLPIGSPCNEYLADPMSILRPYVAHFVAKQMVIKSGRLITDSRGKTYAVAATEPQDGGICSKNTEFFFGTEGGAYGALANKVHFVFLPRGVSRPGTGSSEGATGRPGEDGKVTRSSPMQVPTGAELVDEAECIEKATKYFSALIVSSGGAVPIKANMSFNISKEFSVVVAAIEVNATDGGNSPGRDADSSHVGRTSDSEPIGSRNASQPRTVVLSGDNSPSNMTQGSSVSGSNFAQSASSVGQNQSSMDASSYLSRRPAMVFMHDDTLVFGEACKVGAYKRVHVVPFQDTLPTAYEYDIFRDYLEPYLSTHPLQTYIEGSMFTYHSVQFKVLTVDSGDGYHVGADETNITNGQNSDPQLSSSEPRFVEDVNSIPSTGGGFYARVADRQPLRIDKSTEIFCEGILHPTLRNLLSPQLLEQLSYLPPGLQMMLLSSEVLASPDVYERLLDMHDTLVSRHGLTEEQISALPETKFTREGTNTDLQTCCMVCLADFKAGDEIRTLPCSHVFHSPCIDMWLRRATSCPLCKLNVSGQES